MALVRCHGAAHSNAHLDNCGLCASGNGWIEERDDIVAVAEAVKLCGAPGCKIAMNGPGSGCHTCGKVYFKCSDHGGFAAARRSLRSHMGLSHPKKER